MTEATKGARDVQKSQSDTLGPWGALPFGHGRFRLNRDLGMHRKTKGTRAITRQYTGLEDLELITLNGEYGPEDAAEGPEGRIFMASHSGAILAYDPSTGTTTEFANTGGLPLGVSATVDGTLYIADAAKGLLRIDVDGAVTVLTDSFGGAPITYADDLDIAPDGSIYFTDASTKFGAVAHGGAFPASFLDLMEHGGHGRVLRYNPATDETTLILDGLQFANGLAMNAAGTHFLVNETGDYSIKRVSLDGGRSGNDCRKHSRFSRQHRPCGRTGHSGSG